MIPQPQSRALVKQKIRKKNRALCKKVLARCAFFDYPLPMSNQYIIRKSSCETHKVYDTPLFTAYVYRDKPLVVFSNTKDAAAVFMSRKQVADLLKRKFKNHVDRRRQRA